MESSFFVGLRHQGLKKLGRRLRLQVKVRHRLLNLCDCDSVLSERTMKTDKFSRFTKNNNPILLRSYLNLISATACSETVHLWFGLLRTIHYFIRICKIVKTGTAYAESSFLVGLRRRLWDFKKIRTPIRLRPWARIQTPKITTITYVKSICYQKDWWYLIRNCCSLLKSECCGFSAESNTAQNLGSCSTPKFRDKTVMYG